MVVYLHVGLRFQNRGEVLLGYGRVCFGAFKSEHVSEAKRKIFRFVGVHSAQSLTVKANASLMILARSPVNQILLRSRSDITFLW